MRTGCGISSEHTGSTSPSTLPCDYQQDVNQTEGQQEGHRGIHPLSLDHGPDALTNGIVFLDRGGRANCGATTVDSTERTTRSGGDPHP
eukprot:8347248-Pyramimonas_sp.AAC.1